MRPVVWSDESLGALDRIHAYIGKFSQRGADRVVERLRGAARNLESFPRSARVVPEFGEEQFRELLVDDYRLLYRLMADGVEIVTVFHGSGSLE